VGKKHLSLFNGIGGFQLAAKWAGWENIAHVEIDEWCNKVTAKNFPESKCHTDIFEFNGEEYNGTVDVISGGFPCQPFSTASHGNRVAEDLSPQMVRVVKEIRPKIIVGENVQEEPIKNIAEQFRNIGYRTTYFRIGAYELGADHQRNRWWVVAYSDNEGKFLSTFNAKMGCLQKIQDDTWGFTNYSRTMGIFNGVSDRMDRLKSLGNAIVPQVAYEIFAAINQTGL